MERIASFCVDHTRLDRGMYLSRQDGDVLTWDIRMKKPNHGDYLSSQSSPHSSRFSNTIIRPVSVSTLAKRSSDAVNDGLFPE